jgi:hypothetical protein
LRLTLLAPEIVEALLERQGSSLTVESLTKQFPVNWCDQRSALDLG